MKKAISKSFSENLSVVQIHSPRRSYLNSIFNFFVTIDLTAIEHFVIISYGYIVLLLLLLQLFFFYITNFILLHFFVIGILLS